MGNNWDVFKTSQFMQKKSHGENLSNCKIKRSAVLFFLKGPQINLNSFKGIKMIKNLTQICPFNSFSGTVKTVYGPGDRFRGRITELFRPSFSKIK